MSNAHTISEGGLARDANGNVADMPSELVSVLSEELLNIVGFLHALKREAKTGFDDMADDDDTLTSSSSRANTLVYLIDGKVREILDGISPYV